MKEELMVDIVNDIIWHSIMHGADAGGSYSSNTEGLERVIVEFINVCLKDKYIIKYIDREGWLNIPQIVRKEG